MKLSEARPCDSCGGFISPVFYVVRSSLAIISPTAGRQVGGLTLMFGSLALAESMAPDDDVIKIAGDEDPKLMTEIYLCQDCYMSPINLAEIVEKRNGNATQTAIHV
jgi:hypothetical protein